MSVDTNRGVIIHDDLLPPESDDFHIVFDGVILVLTNFDVNVSDLKPQHKPIIDRLVIPFIEKFVKMWGGGTYNLTVVGSASASGGWELDMDLSAARASKAFAYVDQQFKKKQRIDPVLASAVLMPNYASVGKTFSEKDPSIKGRTNADIDKVQGYFRNVQFIFTAVIAPPKGASIFKIREHYHFKFKAKEEQLPEFIKDLENLYKKIPGVITLGLGELLSKVLKPITEKIPFLGIATDMFKFMIPQQATYCYEIKNKAELHALYRFDGTEHAEHKGLSDLLACLGSLFSFFKKVSDIYKSIGKYDKRIEALLKDIDDFFPNIDKTLRPIVGDSVADSVKAFLELAKSGQLYTAVFAPNSGWQDFKFYGGGADHSPLQCGGPAKRYYVGALAIGMYEVDFAGYVPNNWSDYNATAYIKTFSGNNDLFYGHSMADGTFTQIGGAYTTDLRAGPGDPVVDS
ncbi:MAG: hypothetical protein P4L55_11390 [Syntrophobacteraceae bacterium]|nr:hypothetical protein [Syntrophobacteraceae bacterium]